MQRGEGACAPGEIPWRRCLLSGVSQPQTGLVRFVIGPEKQVVPDVDAKLPGRGFWLSARRGVVETARVKKIFSKAARAVVCVPEDLAEQVDGLIARRVLSLVGLNRRAGALVYGYEKVVAALRGGCIAFLMEAADAAGGGREKIRRAGKNVPVVDLFGSVDLGAAVGRQDVVHVAIKTGRLAERLLSEAGRLACYRGVTMDYGDHSLPRMKGKAEAT